MLIAKPWPEKPHSRGGKRASQHRHHPKHDKNGCKCRKDLLVVAVPVVLSRVQIHCRIKHGANGVEGWAGAGGQRGGAEGEVAGWCDGV